MPKSAFKWLVCLAGGALLGWPLPTAAVEVENILAPKAGPVLILPHVGLAEAWQGNLFYLNDNQDQPDDLVTTLSSGISLQYGQLEGNQVVFDYTLSQLLYNDYNELDHDNHSLGFGIEYDNERKLKLTGTDRIAQTQSFLRGSERVYAVMAVQERMIERLSFNDDYRLDYKLGEKTGIYLRGNYNATDYEEEAHYYSTGPLGARIPYAFYDLSTWGSTAGFQWNALNKVTFFGEGFYGQTSVERNIDRMEVRPDSDFAGGFIGATIELRELFTGTVKAGYQSRQVDLQPGDSSKDSHSLPVFVADLDYQASERRNFSMTYLRESRVSAEDPRWAYAADVVTLQVTQAIGIAEKWQASLGTTFELDTYDTADNRKYNWFRFDAGLSYLFNPWLRANLRYDFDMLDSNRGNIDYDAHGVTLSVLVGFGQ